jgi:NADH dehydrogenase
MAKAGESSLSRKHVLILGAGFAGLYTALHLDNLLPRDAPVDITLVDQNHFHLFTPLLHEAASGVIHPGLIMTPIRRLLRGSRVRFLRARVDKIELDRQEVQLCCMMLNYDILVIALGSVTNFYGLESIRGRALELKTASDAEQLRCHIINRFEAATRERDPQRRRRLLTFTVVGGGCTGVEAVTELREFLLHLQADQYNSIPLEEIRTVLVEMQDRVLPQMAPALSKAALQRMKEMGIEVLLNTQVRDWTDEGLIFADSRPPLPTDTVIWVAGVRANPVVAALPLEKDKYGRIVVDSYLRVPGRPNVYVLGDAAHARHPQTGKVYPPTAQVAYRQAPVAAANIAADLTGGTPRIFDFTYIGDLVSLGRFSGVADPFGRQLRGFSAWAMWKFYYLLRLVGWQNRLRVALNWIIALLFPAQSSISYECSPECAREMCL